MVNAIKSTLQTPTPDLSQSLGFYQQLGFQILATEPIGIVTDGKAVIEINPDRKARAGLRCYATDWSDVVEKLKAHSQVIAQEGISVAADPSGIYLHLIEGTAPDLSGIDGSVAAMPGNFAGVSVEALNFERSLQFWQTLSYESTAGGADQGWISLSNGSGIDLSITAAGACPHLFFNPSLTYFNGGKNLPIIAQIRAAGVPITEEITAFNEEGIVDNIIIRDPGGLGFFVFND